MDVALIVLYFFKHGNCICLFNQLTHMNIVMMHTKECHILDYQNKVLLFVAYYNQQYVFGTLIKLKELLMK